MIKPVGDKILMKLEREDYKLVGDKKIYIQTDDDSPKYGKYIIIKLGDKVTKDLKEGKEVLLHHTCYKLGIRNKEDYFIVSQNDIWGIIEDDNV